MYVLANDSASNLRVIPDTSSLCEGLISFTAKAYASYSFLHYYGGRGVYFHIRYAVVEML